MKHCVIITGYIEGSIRTICPELFHTTPEVPAFTNGSPLILCADGGYRLAQKEGFLPHVIIGDFDTFDGMNDDSPEAYDQIIRVPVMKDDTDTMLCIKYGLEQGCDSFLIVGGIGGRLDHTFANLQSMAYLASQGKQVVMKDEETCITLLAPGTHVLQRSDAPFADHPSDIPNRPYQRFSLFSWSPKVEDLSIRGGKYSLEHGTLESNFPLGISNEFIDTTVEIEFHNGLLLVIRNHQR